MKKKELQDKATAARNASLPATLPLTITYGIPVGNESAW